MPRILLVQFVDMFFLKAVDFELRNMAEAIQVSKSFNTYLYHNEKKERQVMI